MLNVTIKSTMLNVIILSVVMLNVIAPLGILFYLKYFLFASLGCSDALATR
jgi:hypothetical protein